MSGFYGSRVKVGMRHVLSQPACSFAYISPPASMHPAVRPVRDSASRQLAAVSLDCRKIGGADRAMPRGPHEGETAVWTDLCLTRRRVIRDGPLQKKC